MATRSTRIQAVCGIAGVLLAIAGLVWLQGSEDLVRNRPRREFPLDAECYEILEKAIRNEVSTHKEISTSPTGDIMLLSSTVPSTGPNSFEFLEPDFLCRVLELPRQFAKLFAQQNGSAQRLDFQRLPQAIGLRQVNRIESVELEELKPPGPGPYGSCPLWISVSRPIIDHDTNTAVVLLVPMDCWGNVGIMGIVLRRQVDAGWTVDNTAVLGIQ